MQLSEGKKGWLFLMEKVPDELRFLIFLSLHSKVWPLQVFGTRICKSCKENEGG